jgi:acyl transferase domain-containing protein/enoyl-CoA hydratase/carnithine racemase/acyl carrier protein
MKRPSPNGNEPIAIIGASVRLPQADSLEAFWKHLEAGRSLITEVPPQRWDAEALRGNPGKGNKTSSIWGGFVADADCFDAAFFNISPREAAWMDPQQRFAMELAWKAIEDAGYPASALAGSRTGVYMGVCHWDYAELLEKNLAHVDAYTPTGIAFSIIANRISHFFDFRGPSIANDTACAASMMSVYEAVRALQAGECDTALAGGVNLAWSPNHFVAFSKSGMLSKDGASKAFDQRADGYVRGEGGAMLLLKPLSKAQADGDPIHALIRGIGTNHGGRTNSLTVTNPKAQAELIAEVYRDAGVTPDSVSYIEAHGPGTPLGDPIEIAGLKEAFGALYREAGTQPLPGSCSIGSVKTNVGHLEGAAGVTGIVKVLAAMRHDALPPNVDFTELNSLIDFSGTGFRIQSELTAWPRSGEHPRRAGVSSFGFGGSNVHVLMEDAMARVDNRATSTDAMTASGPMLFPLSAKDDERLLAYAAELLSFVEADSDDLALSDLAYTLQTGREAMEARVAFIADGRADLIGALRTFIDGTSDLRVRRASERSEPENALQGIADRWLDRGAVDWALLHDGAKPKKIHALTYPFARVRHWMDESLGGKDTEGTLHPLLQRNVSRLGAHCYRSRFKGAEFFWADHHVGEVQVLPGVVYLEMARAAFELATGAEHSAALRVRFENVVWTRPIRAAAAPVAVEIRLQPRDKDRIAFEIECMDAASRGSANGQGTIIFAAADAAAAPAIDIAALRTRAKAMLEPDAAYLRLRNSGMNHGPAFQVMSKLYKGEDFVLASLKLPRTLQASLEIYPLHPILLDAAIQAWVGFDEAAQLMAPAVPFACRQIETFGPCENTMWALVRPTASAKADPRLKRFDIDLCDKDGRVRVRFHELALRIMSDAAESESTLYSTGEWLPQALVVDAAPQRETTVLLAGFAPDMAAALAQRVPMNVAALDLAPGQSTQETVRAWFGSVLAKLAERMRAKPKLRQQFLVIAADKLPAYLTAPLAALLKTAAIEHPKFEGAVLNLIGTSTVDRLTRIISTEHQRRDTFTEIRYDKDDHRTTWRPIISALPAGSASASLQSDASYWISGGLGGLGLLFAAALAARGARRIVLSGRSEVADAAREQLGHLRQQGIAIHTARCDVANGDDVAQLVAWIEENVGPLKGVIHAAGTLHDGYILNKDSAGIDAVFAPKVAGTLNIDAATSAIDLDFFVLCSSVAAVFGNAGQSDYAGANAFMDAYAEHRAGLTARGERRGATLSIAWPLWAEGGMRVDASSLAALQRRFGTVPLPTQAGLQAFQRILDAGQPARISVYHGAPEKITDLVQNFGTAAPHEEIAASVAGTATHSQALASANPGDLLPRTIGFLKDALGELIQMEPSKIKSNRKLEEYGLDSIVIVELTNRLEESLGPLSKTLFFEYVDLEGVAGYLVEEHGAALAAALPNDEVDDNPEAVAAGLPVNVQEQPLAPTTDSMPATEIPRADHFKEERGTHDIAIVGMSLRVAKAESQEAFWDMLAHGDHGFEKYPSSRWNHDALLHPERDVLGKTVVQTGAFLDGVDEFDPRYFRISQAEAELMSPEVRLFLQSCVEAFEDAGYSRETMQKKLGGDVAVIVGSMTNEYDLFGFQNMLMRGALASGSYTGTVPNMVSYFYGFTGPSYFLDTMCSAAATCVHEAVHMLRAGRCKMALAGGVSLLLHPQKLIATSQEHFTTKTAEVIRGYGLGADGTILGEGVGALVMKTLADAERDGDHIYAVIKGTAVSNAGVRNGFTVPNPHQQARAIEQALEDGGIDARTIDYVEGHGSGTSLGDPIEIKALTQAYRKHTADLQFCPIGTVKSNIAHLLGASGLAGIAKVLMQFKHGQLAPSLHAQTLNPNIPFAQTPFYVQRELADWPRRRDASGRALPHRAGVTSIGAGGMNSHIILEEYLAPAIIEQQATGPELFVFSAMTQPALLASIERFRKHLATYPNLPLADIAYTLQVGKNELPCRLALKCATRSELLQALQSFSSAPGTAAGLHYTKNILEKDPQVDDAQLAQATSARQLDLIAGWWVDGVAIDWDSLAGSRRPRRVSLPAYPFERVRCWYPEFPDAPSVVNPLGSKLKLHPFVGVNRSDLSGLHYTTAIYLNELLDYVYTRDRIQHVLPTVLPEIFAALARIAGLEGPLAIRALTLRHAVNWAEVAELACELEARAGGELHIVLHAQKAGGERLLLADADVCVESMKSQPSIALPQLRENAVRVIEHDAFYRELAGGGLRFGPYLEVVQRAYLQSDRSILCEIAVSHPQQDFFKSHMQLPPRLLGAAHQALIFGRPDGAGLALAHVAQARIGAGEVTHLLLEPGAGQDEFDVCFLDDAGAVVAALEGVLMLGADRLAQSIARPMRAAAIDPPRVSVAVTEQKGDIRRERLTLELRSLVAGMLKFSLDDVFQRAPFYELGFDSISLTRLANEINAVYGSTLTPAIFFECEHIDALSAHLISRHAVNPSGDGNAEIRLEQEPTPSFSTEPAPLAISPISMATQAPATKAATSAGDRIAIIGLAARLPGSENPEDFFSHLIAGHDLVTDFPMHRYAGAPQEYRERIAAAGFAKQGGFLTDIDRFDAAFFKTSPLEAQRMDPQQRLMLETVWRALDDAGYRPGELPQDTGVFVGVSGQDYASLLREHGIEHDGFVSTGNSLAMVANRVSYQLDVHGPSESVDTACSSSLVALLRAADAIRSGRCRAAIAGGVNLTLAIEGFEGPHQAGMLSSVGRCQSFSKSADGYVRGEGVLALLLKPLTDAVRDGDRILGVLAGGAENHGGRAGSLTAPNVKSQAELVERAMAGIDPASIGYIETHGTGTSLGDPVEINGLRHAYRSLMGGRDKVAAPFIGLGSVKSNIGHLEAAAGLAGVVKVLMAMRAGELPATLHCAEISPYVELQDSPFYLVRARQPWPRRIDAGGREMPRRAGVSSFGFGGANAHVVLEEYPQELATQRRAALSLRRFADTRFWIPTAQGTDAMLMMSARWTETPLDSGKKADVRRKLIFPCEIAIAPSSGMESEVVAVPVLSGDIGQRYMAMAALLLETLQRLLGEPDGARVLVQLVVPLGDERELYEGLGAMLDTAGAESPRLLGQVISVPSTIGADALARILAAEALHSADRRVRHADGRRWARVWTDLNERADELLPVSEGKSWRAQGVYLITGGLGALGRVVATDIARHAHRPTLILLGSSPLNLPRSGFLDELRALGATAEYHRLDMTDAGAAIATVNKLIESHGRMHGVIHCAGIHRDSAIVRKTPADLHAVLGPKVAGTLALERACRALKLDMFVLFSSLGGAFGNAGQADYAAANGFLDAFALLHGGAMTAIDWPLWRDGGMRVDADVEQAFFRKMGQRPLSTVNGVAALHSVLASGAHQVAVIAGDAARIRTFFAQAQQQPLTAAPLPASVLPVTRGGDGAALADRVGEKLGQLLAKMTGMRADQIDARMPLEEYGIDSLMITRLNRELGETFGTLSKTLFFEHRTLAQLARHLALQHAEACLRWTGFEGGAALATPAVAASEAPVAQAARSMPAGREPIAIIGISGQYPDAPDLESFWRNLASGKDSISEVPTERWSLDGFYHQDPIEAVELGLSYSKWGGFLEGFAEFDPIFFKISPRDAAAMDPQERLFLMSAWMACEDGGYTRARFAAQHGSRVGVFAGVTKTGFAQHAPFRTEGGATIRPGTSFGSVANRVSHVLDLNGPSMPIDTMCSSSLSAIHEACEHLHAGDCELAIAGGVNLYLHPTNYVELSALRMLSEDGRCKSFGKGGNGFVPGEGVGCVLLKPLSRALADGDRIHAVIRASAINHGGKTNGYTVPNPNAQRDVVRAALERAGLDARAVSYVEAHGTGTDLGDPIEVTGLTQAFRADTDARGFCALGSAKSNIGHLEAAAGIAGLTKVVLQMQHGALAPSLHAAEINPNIDFSETPFMLQRALSDWRPMRDDGNGGMQPQPRIAGVSSFGAGGANAHVIVEEWQETAGAVSDGSAMPIPVLLSARDEERLRESAQRLLAFIETHGQGVVVDLVLSSQVEACDVVAQIGRLLADLISVAAGEIDAAESFDSYGVEPAHLLALRAALETRFDIALDGSVFVRLKSVDEIASELRARIPDVRETSGVASAGTRKTRVSLADLAYTLQVGREAMEVRLAIEATTLPQLAASLRAFLNKGELANGIYFGSARDHRHVLAPLGNDADFDETVTRWMAQGKLARLLGLWVKGMDVDWARLPRSGRPQIITLPTYPFARERYWIPANSDASALARVIECGFDAAERDLLLAQSEELELRIARLVRTQLRSMAAGAITPAYSRWRQAIDALLARFDDDAQDEGMAVAWVNWDSYRKEVAARGGPLAQIALAEATLRALPDILSGTQQATAVMFPAGAMKIVEAVYKQNAVAARFSAGIAAGARAFVERRLSGDPAAALRILEIGAGTGGTSEPVFEALAPFSQAIAEYRYTDVSRSFLIHAERNFRQQAPYLTTALFDVEKPLAGQDVETAGYDLVIAANVLHATRDMHGTMSNVLALLSPGGMLLVNETSSSTLFTHVTFGLLDGWWRFEDGARRIPGSPALTSASWRAVLEEVGFHWIACSRERDQALGQQLIAASLPSPYAGRPQSSLAGRAQAGKPVSLHRQIAGDPDSPLHPASGRGSNSLRELILRLLAETLNVAPTAINVRLSFADYGLDSILGVELVHKLRRALGIDLEVTRLFDFSSVAQLEAFLASDYAQAVTTFTNTSTPAAESAPVVSVRNEQAAQRSPISSQERPAVSAQPIPTLHEPSREPIAIVGMSGRFAQSENVEQLWEHLLAGRDLVGPVTRFDLKPFYQDAAPGSYCDRGSFIEGVECFDPVFFGISGLEATYMDPQQRLFLEEAWKTLENAGHAGADMEGRRCGVFVGCSSGDYQELFRSQPPGQAFWGNTSSLIPARIAYFLDFKGPAVAVDTACSSSLVAVHLACQSIWSGDSEMALAGGVFVQSSPRFYKYANQARMLSASGRCAAFGSGADGIVPGEAVAAILLRPLSAALADGDTILGVIAGTGTNQDGATNGITAPSALSQERLMRQVYDDFGIDPSGIGMFEAHGTGTVLGDPIEHAALTRAFGAYTDRRGYCALGSIKSNLGHTTTAAGITGLVKILLALKHDRIPPAIHIGEGNPAIRIEDSAFFLNSTPHAWPTSENGARRAAISSFGFSGTNAHAVIEEAPAQAPEPDDASHLVVLSARNAGQLRQQAERLLAHLGDAPQTECADLAFTLLMGRRHFHHRLAVVVRDIAELSTRLRDWLAGDAGTAVGVAQLDEKNHREDDAGTAAGNALIEQLGNGNASSDDEYRTSLQQLAQLFLTGSRLQFGRLFARGRRRRIALPTYPFAANRYWVEPPAAPAAAPAATPTLAASSAGGAHRLAALSSIASTSRSTPPQAGRKVALAPLVSSATTMTVQALALKRLPDLDGVRRLELAGSWNKEMQAAIARELEQAGIDENVRAVLLSGGSGWQTSTNVEQAQNDASATPLACPVPVIAALGGGASGAALLLAMHCDFVVLDEAGRYACKADLPATQTAILEQRFGAQSARQVLGDGRWFSGAELHELCTGMAVVSAERVEACALELARQVAEAPRMALVELKRHMRADPIAPAGTNDRSARTELESLLASSQRDDVFLLPGSGSKITLESAVIELEAFNDGVALIRMCERDHKNTFTEAFMRGLLEAFAVIRNTPAFKAVVLTGHDSYFACGGTKDGLEELQRGATRFTDLKIYSLPLECKLPVIAAMQGHAIGAGWSLGMFCDQALFSAESVYHSNYLWFGFTPGAGATLVFPERLGDELGREVLFTAREYKGRELAERSVGLTVLPSSEVLPRALAIAHQLARAPRERLIQAKASMAQGLLARLDAVFARELAMHEKTFIGNARVKERIGQLFGQTPAASAPVAPSRQQQSPAVSANARREQIRHELVATLAEELIIDASEIRDGSSFLELGLDSILAVTWVRKLNARFSVTLPATSVYGYPTVGALAEHLAAMPPNVMPAAAFGAASVAPVPASAATRPIAVSAPKASASVLMPTPERHDKVRRELVATLAEELIIGVEEIRDGSGFLELGLDSILAVTWVRKLNALFGLTLPATAVYAHPTVGALVTHVAGLAGDEIAAEAAARSGVAAAACESVPEPKPEAAPVLAQETIPSAAGSPAASRTEPAPVCAFQPISRSARSGDDAIAIIGASGRFPKAPDLDAFWDNIRSGRDCVDEVPADRWIIADHFDEDMAAPDKSYCKWMGSIADIDLFDSLFFNITPREAELMDPQQRLFLQHAWHAIEDAALLPSKLSGSRCGVFVGSGPSGYADLISERNAYSMIGSAGSILAARIAYLLDLRGPSISLDTACSTSLVAIAQACNSLLLGESDLALAGGACVLIGPTMFVDTSKVNMLSKDGRCFTFDHRANGFVPGEGVGVLLLKRLADAERDGDPIRAVIRGWGVNQDGKTNGITAPNPQAQSRLMKSVYENFGIDPASIGLIEAHGTGTPMGDPIEIEGLTDGFAAVAGREGTCALGSVKSNVGHLLAAAGVAGAIKAMLALEHRELPPSINFERQNEHITLAGTPFYVNTGLREWPAKAKTPRRAAVSAFGFSGTNAHLVLEEYSGGTDSRVPVTKSPTGDAFVCVLSARADRQLVDYAATLARFVLAHPALDLGDLAFTLQTARMAFDHRLAFVFHDREDLLAMLKSVGSERRAPAIHFSERDAKATALLGDDEDARELLQKWMAAGRLDKLAASWANGVPIDWQDLAGAKQRNRIHTPGYPFARDRHWVKRITPAAAPPEFCLQAKPANRHPLIERNSSTLDCTQFSGSFSGEEPYLTHFANGAERLLLGLFYPEMARAAGELATQRPVFGLKNLVWGKPTRINGKRRELSVVLSADAGGLLYHICADGEEAAPCHVGELMLDANDAFWPDSLEPNRLSGFGVDRSDEFRRFAACTRTPLAQGAAVVREVWGDGAELMAKLSRTASAAGMANAGDAMQIDPLHLDAIWKLVGFHAANTNHAEAGFGVPCFPYALRSLVQDGALPDELLARIWRREAGQDESGPLTIALYDMDGIPRMVLDGLMTEQHGDLDEITFDEKESA